MCYELSATCQVPNAKRYILSSENTRTIKNLSKIKEKEMDHSFTIMGKFLKANGIKMKDTEKANLLIKMELSLKKDLLNVSVNFD